MKKSLVFCLVFLLFGSLALFAEGSKDTAASDIAVSQAGVLPIVDETLSFSAYIRKYPWGDIDYEDNLAAAWLEEKTNIHLDFVVASDDTKRDILLNSGDYPEIFLSGGFSNLDVMKYGVDQQIFLPLNGLIDEYGAELKRAFKEIPTMKGDLIAPDGNIYGVPALEGCYHCQSAPKMWINTAWLETLGLDMPETTEEFYDVMRAFKERDPNGNGKADEIPLTGCINTWRAEPERFFMNSFIYTDSEHYLRLRKGNIDFVANKPEFKESLMYSRRLYDDGLFDPAAFTQGFEQLTQLAMNPGDMIVGAFAAGHVAMGISLEDSIRTRAYNEMPPLEGPDGVRWATFNEMHRISEVAFTVTDECKNPAAAYRFADFLLSKEASMINYNGVEGVDWRWAKAGEKDLMGRPAQYTILRPYEEVGVAADRNRLLMSPHYFPFEWYMARADTSESIYDFTEGAYETRLYQATKKYAPYWPDETIPPLFFNAEGAEEISQLKTNITNYVVQSTVQFITGAMDLDNDWDDYVKGLNNLGLDRYVELYQETYDRNMAAKR